MHCLDNSIGKTTNIPVVGFALFDSGTGLGEGADLVFFQHTAYLTEIGGQHRHTRLGEIGDAVGQRIAIVEAKVFQQAHTKLGLPREGTQLLRHYPPQKLHTPAPGLVDNVILKLGKEVAVASHNKFVIGEILHSINYFSHTTAHIYSTLI